MRRRRRRPSIARNSPTPTSRPPAAISTTSSIPATAGRASSKPLRRSPRSSTGNPPRRMATFLSSGVLAAALSQAPGGAPAATRPDAIAAAQARLAQDSGDGRAWLALGRAYLTAFDEAQARRARSDSGAPRAALDGAEQALARAAALLRPAGRPAEADSAPGVRGGSWGGRAPLAGGGGGGGAGAGAGG